MYALEGIHLAYLCCYSLRGSERFGHSSLENIIFCALSVIHANQGSTLTAQKCVAASRTTKKVGITTIKVKIPGKGYLMTITF